MNNWETTRVRGKTLLIVEGHHEQKNLFYHLSKCYPELHLEKDKIVIYGTNIYALHRVILREYGPSWNHEDVDLAYCQYRAAAVIPGRFYQHPACI